MEENDNPSEKVAIDKEELNGIEIDAIWNLGCLPRTVHRVWVFESESSSLWRRAFRKSNKKKRWGVSQAYKCPLCDICYQREPFFKNHVEDSESPR